MKEANIQTLFGKYLIAHQMNHTFAFELKISKKKAFPINSVKEHQIQGLLQAKKGCIIKLVIVLSLQE